MITVTRLRRTHRCVTSNPALRWSRGALVVSVLLAGLLSVPAAAATASPTRGQITLYGMQTLFVTYNACDPPVLRRVPSEPTSFLNMPLPDCRVVLINEKGERFILCEGRDTIPPRFRRVRQLLIQLGDTQQCRTTITQEYS